MPDQDKSIEKLTGQPQQKKEQQSTDTRTLNIDVIMNEPRIALLEDASKPNSRALVLQVREMF